MVVALEASNDSVDGAPVVDAAGFGEPLVDQLLGKERPGLDRKGLKLVLTPFEDGDGDDRPGVNRADTGVEIPTGCIEVLESFLVRAKLAGSQLVPTRDPRAPAFLFRSHRVAKLGIRDRVVTREPNLLNRLELDRVHGNNERHETVGDVSCGRDFHGLSDQLLGEPFGVTAFRFPKRLVPTELERFNEPVFGNALPFEPECREDGLFFHMDDENTLFEIETDVVE